MAIWSLTIFLLGQSGIASFLVPPNAAALVQFAAEQRLVPEKQIANKVSKVRVFGQHLANPEDCGLNPTNPDAVRPGCDAVVCETIKTKDDCQTANKHGHECRWAGDQKCRTPPHLQRGNRGKAYRESEHDILPFGRSLGKKAAKSKDCGLNPTDPDQVRPGCDAVVCEEIETKAGCLTANKHGHECSWGGDQKCRTPPHLQRAPRGKAHRESGEESVLAGILRFAARIIIILAVFVSLGLLAAYFLGIGPFTAVVQHTTPANSRLLT